jgi:hypothetical protein
MIQNMEELSESQKDLLRKIGTEHAAQRRSYQIKPEEQEDVCFLQRSRLVKWQEVDLGWKPTAQGSACLKE